MTSIKAAAAVVVVAIVVIAAAAYVVLNNNGGGNGNGDAPGDAIGTAVEVGDNYTLVSTYTSGGSGLGADSTTETTYTVTDLIGDDQVAVDVSSTAGTYPETMQKDDFLGKVSVVDSAAIGDYVRTEIIRTPMGDKECYVHHYSDSAGTIDMYNWVGVGGNVIYQTTITLNAGLFQVEQQTTTLSQTNMIETGATDIPSVPTGPTGSMDLRTDLRVGDYVEFSKYDDDGRERERFEIVRIDESRDRVYYIEYGDDDVESCTTSQFLAMVLYTGGGSLTTTETIDTYMGSIECNVYEMNGFYNPGFDDFDWEDRVVVWASVDSNIIYKIETYDDWYDDDDRWDDWYDDRESYYLTATSLMDASGGSGTNPPVDPTPPVQSQNRYGVELAVGDSYTIRDDRNETETYTIISIDGNYLTVREESSRDRTEIERMSANSFLDDILISADQLESRYTPLNQSQDVNGVMCDVYQERYDDDRETICVQQNGSNFIIWQKTEERYDVETLISLNIASL